MVYVDVDRLYRLQGDLTDTAFSKKIGISRSQLWRIRTRRSSAGTEFLAKFKAAYPEERIEDYIFFETSVPSKEHIPQTEQP